jgi:hypothetical protein
MAITDGDLVERMAKKHSVSPAAVQLVLSALRSGGGRMAQFSHADFGGMSQWSPGMSMVGDMFNSQLKAKLDALCTDIAAHLDSSEVAAGTRSAADEVSYRSMSGSVDWWPAGLGRPVAVGAQNDLRYALVHESGWTCQSSGPFEGCRLTAPGRRQDPCFTIFANCGCRRSHCALICLRRP